jgi:hypothetical protein
MFFCEEEFRVECPVVSGGDKSTEWLLSTPVEMGVFQ